jgi:hypothetical protein
MRSFCRAHPNQPAPPDPHPFPQPNPRKRWILRYAPLFNSPLVHHAVAYACSTPEVVAKIEALAANNSLGPFNEDDTPSLCHDSWLLAAPFMRPFEAPAGSGLPFGGAAAGGGPAWVSLQIHYNNPEGLEGQVDPGSGLWLEYTDGPVQEDIGLLTLGQYWLGIPPGRESFSAPTSVCPGSCTKK